MRSIEPIQRAVAAVGGENEMAEKAGVSRPMVYQWLKGLRPVSANRCIRIEEATGGAVTRYELRPDVFGEAPKEQAA